MRLYYYFVVVVSFDDDDDDDDDDVSFGSREALFTNVENGERKKSLWMRKGGREGSKRDSRAEMCSTRTFALINRRLCSFFLSHHVQSTSAETTAFTSSTSGRRGTSS